MKDNFSLFLLGVTPADTKSLRGLINFVEDVLCFILSIAWGFMLSIAWGFMLSREWGFMLSKAWGSMLSCSFLAQKGVRKPFFYLGLPKYSSNFSFRVLYLIHCLRVYLACFALLHRSVYRSLA